jgi:hypothetical protein
MLSRQSLIISALAAGLVTALAGAQAQDMSKLPDWSGQWRKPDGIGNGQWDVTKPTGRGQNAPLKPQYKAMHEASIADQAAGGQGNNPTGQCIPHGMPRMMIGVYPMELVVTPKTTYMLSDYNEPRRIFTDGRNWPQDLEALATFNGYSIGQWRDEDGDGRYDVLEVETRGLKGPRNFDQEGIPLHEDQQSIIKERFYSDKTNADLLHIQITTIDHALTEPWTVIKTFQRDHNPIWMFVDCSEDTHHVWIGDEGYFVSGDGFLMPSKKGQKAPDLRFFKPEK